jgi:hypothetical protein
LFEKDTGPKFKLEWTLTNARGWAAGDKFNVRRPTLARLTAIADPVFAGSGFEAAIRVGGRAHRFRAMTPIRSVARFVSEADAL